MINVDIEPKYIQTLDKFDTDYIDSECRKNDGDGAKSYFEYMLKGLDCSIVDTIYGFRTMQTLGYPYANGITRALYLIEHHIDESEQEEYLNRLHKLHRDNLEFENINPPTFYGGDKARNAYEKKIKATTKEKKPKEKRETVAERKLKEKAKKLNALTFKVISV